MPISLLPPVGDAIVLGKSKGKSNVGGAGGRPATLAPKHQPLNYDGYTTEFLASGTAALAQALMLAKQRFGGTKVLVPAYGCPDLLAAAVFAGLQPVLVDLAADSPHYDLDHLASALSADVAAIIAVNFLGVPAQLDQIAALIELRGKGCALVEDDAQWLPIPTGSQHALVGDYVITSFGRGKPLSLLGGGMLLVKAELPAFEAPTLAEGSVLTKLKIIAYNALRWPPLYALMDALPLGLGATRYHPLEGLAPLDSVRHALLSANLERYESRSQRVRDQLQGQLAKARLLDVIDLSGLATRLLRYPILVPAKKRDRLVDALREAGIGATAMYVLALPEIEGVEAAVDGICGAAAVPNASNFASRLITLPVHSGVSSKHVRNMVNVLRAELSH